MALLASRLAAGILILCGALLGQSPPPDLSQASLEDLMNLKVTSVSKKEQKLSKTGAAIFVITQEDIRRSGATNIPDLLRLAPGVDVARVDANRWAISIRGFSDQHANKVLVLIDGRSVYSPSFSGVFWDLVDVPLEDIERIEVIRGPGGTVWGANAVNGVINIITKNAQSTRGGLLSAGTGSEDRADARFNMEAKSARRRLPDFRPVLRRRRFRIPERPTGGGWMDDGSCRVPFGLESQRTRYIDGTGRFSQNRREPDHHYAL